MHGQVLLESVSSFVYMRRYHVKNAFDFASLVVKGRYRRFRGPGAGPGTYAVFKRAVSYLCESEDTKHHSEGLREGGS